MTVAPGLDGVNADDPAFLIGKNQSRSARDLIRLRGLMTNLRGWAYFGSTVAVDPSGPLTATLHAVTRDQYELANVKRTYVSDDSGQVYDFSGVSGTVIGGGGGVVPAIPRAMYHDMRFWMVQDGIHSCVLTTGSVSGSTSTPTTVTSDAGQSTLRATAGSWAAMADRGAFMEFGAIGAVNCAPTTYLRILERESSTRLAIEDMRTAGTVALGAARGTAEPTGQPFPCIPIYDAGTGSFDNVNDDFDGVGTKWINGRIRVLGNDALLVLRGTTWEAHYISDVNSDTSIQLLRHDRTDANCRYKVLRAVNARESAAHRGSIFFTGCEPDPNIVWASPQGWNPGLPPGFVPPYDPTVLPTSTDPNDFMLFPIAVPTPYDGEAVIGLLSRPEGLRCIKSDAVYTIFGDYPSFSQGLMARGAGTIDIRSVQNLPSGGYFAGKQGIFRDADGTLEDITSYRTRSGGVNRKWRSAIDGFVPGTDFCTIGETDGRLFVSATADAGATTFAMVYDLRDRTWNCDITQTKARFFMPVKIPDEVERLLWVGDAQLGRVMDSAPAVNGLGLLKNGDATTPAPQYVSGTGLGEAAGIEGEVLVGDVNVHANLYDASTTAPTLAATLTHAAGVRQAAAGESKSLGSVNADATDAIDRHEFVANRSGRQVQLQVDATLSSGTNTAATKLELAEMVVEVFDAGGAT